MTNSKGECFDCGRNTWHSPQEYYAVTNAVWLMACAVEPKLPARVMLCIGCLEQRLGRELTYADFKDCGLTRNPRPTSSKRLLNRLSR